nr:hypothetical protein [Tanacetum cinerariifolium]
MSSASSAVTYTSVYIESEPARVFWGADEELSDAGSSRIIVYGYDRLPMQPPHGPDYVPRPMYPEYIPLEDEHALLAEDEYTLPSEEQPLPLVDSPTVESPGYVAESDPKEDQRKPVIPPSTDTTTTGARITIWLQAAISFLLEAEVERHLAMPTPPPSPLTSLSPPSAEEHLARMASTQELIDAVTAALPSPPLPPLPPPLYIPPPVDRMDDIPETEMPPHKSTLDAEARRRGIREVRNGIRDTWVDSAEAGIEIAPMTLGEVNTRVTELAELHEHDTHDLYALLEDAQDSRTHISQRVTMDSQRVDLFMEDRIAHQETILILQEEAYAAREA